MKAETPEQQAARLARNGHSVGETSTKRRNGEVSVTPTSREFPTHTFPQSVGEFIKTASEAIGCHSSFVALPLLGCLGRAIGGKRVIRIKRSWCEHAIIWAAIIGKSGTHKTPAMLAAMRCLNEAQGKALAEHAKWLEEFEVEKACYERDMVAWKRLKNNPEPPPSAPVAPVCPRYVTNDTTIEALAALLAGQSDGILVARDELAGWIGGIAEYKGGKGSDLGHWLACWSGGHLIVDRKTTEKKTIYVPRALVSLVGGIQPAVLRAAIGREHMQDGLCARLLLAMPDPQPVTWSEATIPHSVEQDIADLFKRLLSMAPDFDDEGEPQPIAVEMTPEAKAVWVEYFNRHRAELAHLDDDLAACWSKLEAYAARFALLFHCCEWTEDASLSAIDERTMRAAIELSDWFGGEARRVYGRFVESDEDRQQRELIELLGRIGPEVTARALSKSSRKVGNTFEAEAALDRLMTRGFGEWVYVKPTERGGRPTRFFRLTKSVGVTETPTNPDEVEGFADSQRLNGVWP